MFRLIGLLVRAIREEKSEADKAQTYGDSKSAQAQSLPYDDYAVQQQHIVAAPSNRLTHCERKAGRRAEKRARRDEWRQRKAERRAEWQQRRVERRAQGGCGQCCKNKRQQRREDNLLTTAAVTTTPALTYFRRDGTQDIEGAHQQGGVRFENANAGAGDGSAWGSPNAHDMPPTYDEVVKGK